MKIDWGTLQPSDDLRDAIETSFEPSADLQGETLVLSRSGSEYEVSIAPRFPERPTVLRLRATDLLDVAGRAARLLRALAAHHGNLRRSSVATIAPSYPPPRASVDTRLRQA
jgi:hypothetical protein